MIISLAVAMDKNGIIGSNEELPWHLPADLEHFKSISMGKPVVMGRKTYESIIRFLGKPLPGRKNIIITNNTHYQAAAEVFVLNDPDTIKLKFSDHPEIIFIGGRSLYKYALPLADKMFITEVCAEVTGDTYFPDFDKNEWQEIDRQDFRSDQNNEYDYSFLELQRIKK